jgi:hypothetical protein
MFARALQVDTAANPDRRCIITTLSWVLSTIVVFSVASRLALKLIVRSTRMRVGLDDFFIGLATVSVPLAVSPDCITHFRSSSVLVKLSL